MSDYTPCRDCSRPMRPYGTKLADHPGTMRRDGAMCSRCGDAARAAAARERYAHQLPPARPSTRENRANLRSWLVSRGYAGTSV